MQTVSQLGRNELAIELAAAFKTEMLIHCTGGLSSRYVKAKVTEDKPLCSSECYDMLYGSKCVQNNGDAVEYSTLVFNELQMTGGEVCLMLG